MTRSDSLFPNILCKCPVVGMMAVNLQLPRVSMRRNPNAHWAVSGWTECGPPIRWDVLQQQGGMDYWSRDPMASSQLHSMRWGKPHSKKLHTMWFHFHDMLARENYRGREQTSCCFYRDPWRRGRTLLYLHYGGRSMTVSFFQKFMKLYTSRGSPLFHQSCRGREQTSCWFYKK